MLTAALFTGGARRHIILDGDSITAGGSYTPADATGTHLVTLLRTTCSHNNVAAGGSGAQTCPHTGWNVASVPASDWIYYIDSGINNLYSGGPDAATIIGYLDTAIATVRAAGVRAVVISTIIASTDHDVTQGRLADRLTINDAIRAGHFDADAISDPASDPFFQDPSNYGPEGDGTGDGNTHPGLLGTHYLMTFAAAAINPLL